MNPLVRADMVFLEYPNGGAVFSTSAIAWCGSLSFNNYTNNVSRITENVLKRFASNDPLPGPGDARDGWWLRTGLLAPDDEQKGASMSVVDEFLRRFAASPLHVPQLERVLAAYGGGSPDAFAAAVIESDREAAHPEATRIALEMLANGLIRAGSAAGRRHRTASEGDSVDTGWCRVSADAAARASGCRRGRR